MALIFIAFVACSGSFEFLHNSKFPAKLCQDPAIIEGQEQNKKLSLLRIEPTTSRSSVPHSANCANKKSVGKGDF